MKKNIFKIFSALLVLIAISSCRKEEALNVDFSTYNVDNPIANTPLDTWLTTTFLNEYNIDVIYRYNRYYHGNDRDIASVRTDKVQPQMQTFLEGFLLPYRKVAGVEFIKRYTPKQVVLFGSGSYNPDNSYVLATASAGRQITIYDVNRFDLNAPGDVVGKLRTIHHEFTHILNQIVPMPVDFQLITKSTYLATWTTTSDATALANGYVTPYASSAPGEDFAETTTSLLVLGQAWFDNRANTSSAAGKLALKAKEASIVQYFTINLGIDFRALQKEIQNVVRNTYKYQQTSFRYWMGVNLYKSMTINLANDAVYNTYGISDDFKNVYNATNAAIAAVGGAGRKLNFVRLDFPSATTMTLDVNYSNTAGTVFDATYAFNMALNTTTGQTKFTVGTPGGTTGTWANATVLQTGAQPMINYLINNTFVADWMPANINPDNFNKYAGFYVSGTPTNYFYGLLGQ